MGESLEEASVGAGKMDDGVDAAADQDDHVVDPSADGQQGGEDGSGSKKKKSKKKKKKKKKGGACPVADLNAPIVPPAVEQTKPPTVPIHVQYPNYTYPHGEITLYDVNDARTTRGSEAELLARDRNDWSRVVKLRRCAEVHRQVRADIQEWIQPGVRLVDMCERIEATLEKLIEKDGLVAGQAFPTGCSLNHVAAHYTPNPGDGLTLSEGDIMKVDFGTQVDGHIIDCAFTVNLNPTYQTLVDAVKDATNSGIRHAGIDVDVNDIGEVIQEVMESYQVELPDGNVKNVKVIRNLTGHSIAPYIIHAGKSVPLHGGTDTRDRMVEGELYAIETFGSTGRGLVTDGDDCSHYMVDPDGPKPALRDAKTKELYQAIQQHFGTLAFCRRWLNKHKLFGHGQSLRLLENCGTIRGYPPLVESRGVYTAQWEHTLLLRPTCKEVLSRGVDY